MNRFRLLGCASVVVVASWITTPASYAGADISFGVNAPVGDGNLFFSISSRYFDRTPQVVDDWGRRFHNPDDLAVFLHICSHSRMAPDAVFRYRQQGMPWYDVGMRAGVPLDAWYVPVSRDPFGPYATPYQRYKRHKHDPHYVVRLSDRQVRDLVALRMAHEYYGVAPEVAMEWRRGGSSVQVIMTREYHTRHSNGDGYRDDRGRGKGHGKGHGRGHDERYDDRDDEHHDRRR